MRRCLVRWASKVDMDDFSRSTLARNILRILTLRSQFGKFIVVGCVNAIFSYSVFTVAYLTTHNDNISVMINWFLGILFNFFSTGIFVFSNRSFRRLVPFVVSCLFSMALNLVLINVLVLWGLNALLAQALCLPVVVVVSYVLNSRFVFGRHG